MLVTTDNVVEFMVFDAGIPQEAAYRAWIKPVRQGLAAASLLTPILLMPWLLEGCPASLPRMIELQAPMRALLGKGMLIHSPVVLIAGLAVVREGGSIAMLGVIMIPGRAGLLLPAAFNLALGGRLTPARPWVLGLVGVVTLTSVFGWPHRPLPAALMYRFAIRAVTQVCAPVGSYEIDQGKQPPAEPEASRWGLERSASISARPDPDRAIAGCAVSDQASLIPGNGRARKTPRTG